MLDAGISVVTSAGLGNSPLHTLKLNISPIAGAMIE